MPIRFRCTNCNQLMGIARRKAGTTVRCPSCTTSVIVPQPVSGQSREPRRRAEPHAFERSDFDEIFRQATKRKRTSTASKTALPVAPSTTPREGYRPPAGQMAGDPLIFPSATPPGLGPRRPSVLLIALVLVGALAVSFAVGFITGRVVERASQNRSV